MKEIKFYSTNDEYGEFSSFYMGAPFKKNGVLWKSREHYFQANKFPGTEYETEIRKARGPMEAKILGGDRKKPLRKDWENVKFDIMVEAIIAQCEQNFNFSKILLDTDDAILIEHTRNDKIWGDGGDGKGLNLLGKALMRARDIMNERLKGK